jgi:hypothetical protein
VALSRVGRWSHPRLPSKFRKAHTECPMSVSITLRTLLILLAFGCHGGPGGTDPVNQTRARIENRSSLDMDLSIQRNDGRSTRLGLAPGGETTTFALSPGFTAGASWIRFQARAVRGSGKAVVSEPFPVRAGEEIGWSVPPQ